MNKKYKLCLLVYVGMIYSVSYKETLSHMKPESLEISSTMASIVDQLDSSPDYAADMTTLNTTEKELLDTLKYCKPLLYHLSEAISTHAHPINNTPDIWINLTLAKQNPLHNTHAYFDTYVQLSIKRFLQHVTENSCDYITSTFYTNNTKYHSSIFAYRVREGTVITETDNKTIPELRASVEGKAFIMHIFPNNPELVSELSSLANYNTLHLISPCQECSTFIGKTTKSLTVDF